MTSRSDLGEVLPSRTSVDVLQQLVIGQPLRSTLVGYDAVEIRCPHCGRRVDAVGYLGDWWGIDWDGDHGRLHACHAPLAASVEQLRQRELDYWDAAVDVERQRNRARHLENIFGLAEAADPYREAPHEYR